MGTTEESAASAAGLDAGARDAEWTARLVECDRQWAAFHDRRAAALAPNKAALFAALGAAGVARVVIEFEGSGDSGQMEQAAAFGADDQPMPMPAARVAMQTVAFENAEVSVVGKDLREAIEELAYDLLEQKHGGWENSDGGYGEFTFDTAGHAITLEFNERYTETNYHIDEF